MSFRVAPAVLALASGLMACSPSPSPEQIGKVLEEHPEILVRVIDKHPEKIMDAIQRAAGGAERREESERMAREMEKPLQPDLSGKRVIKGAATAPVTIVAYSDFQCPYCAQGFENIEAVLAAYPTQVRYIHKNLPLDMHPMAMPAALRYEAIGVQDPAKAVKFHDAVFKGQRALEARGEKFLDEAARDAGADVPRMRKDMKLPEIAKRIEADTNEAMGFGFQGTPAYIVGGVSLPGAYSVDAMKSIIDQRLAALKK